MSAARQDTIAGDVAIECRPGSYNSAANAGTAVGIGDGNTIISGITYPDTTGRCTIAPQIVGTTGRCAKLRRLSAAWNVTIPGDLAIGRRAARNSDTANAAASGRIGDGNTISACRTYPDATGCRAGTPHIISTTGGRAKQRWLSATNDGTVAGDLTTWLRTNGDCFTTNAGTSGSISDGNTVCSGRAYGDTIGHCTSAPPIGSRTGRHTKLC